MLEANYHNFSTSKANSAAFETGNQKHRPKRDNAYRQDIVTRIYSYTRGISYNLSSNYTKYFATLRPIFYVLENFHRKFANRVAPPTDGTTKPLVRCKVHLVL